MELDRIINPENIDIPGLIEILEGMEERISNIEEVLEMDDNGYRVDDD